MVDQQVTRKNIGIGGTIGPFVAATEIVGPAKESKVASIPTVLRQN